MFLIIFFLDLNRLPNNNLVLEQVARDTGSASSLLIFSDFTPGDVGMWLISLEWANKIPMLGALLWATGLWFSTWFILKKRGMGYCLNLR